jgi:hypothetical protein
MLRRMRPMLVNTKQKIAVLASGLAIATTGFVTDSQAASAAERATTGDQSAVASAGSTAAERAARGRPD